MDVKQLAAKLEPESLSVEDKARQKILPSTLTIGEIVSISTIDPEEAQLLMSIFRNAVKSGSLKCSEPMLAEISTKRLNGGLLLDDGSSAPIDKVDFLDWLNSNDEIDILEFNDCLLANWWPEQIESENKMATTQNKGQGVFAQFENLCSNEISLMMEEEKAFLVIRKRKIDILPQDLGLKKNSIGWKFLENAAIDGGCLDRAINHSNKNYSKEKNRSTLKTQISRLRIKLTKSMGLKTEPIVYSNGGGYQLTFKNISHKLFNGNSSTSYVDAMDHAMYTEDLIDFGEKNIFD